MENSAKANRKFKKKQSVYLKDDLYINDIAKMKQRLTSLSPDRIILEALKTCHSSEVLNKKKYENLDAIKQQAIIAMSDMLNPNKTTTEINNIYQTKVSEYQTSANLVVAKKEQEHQEYNELLSTIKDKHVDLTIQKSQMKLETDKLLNQLTESKHSIDKLILKYRLIEKMMPLFDLVSTEFNTNNPDSVIKDIQLRKQQEEECQIEISHLNSKVDQTKFDKRKEYQNQKQDVEELSKKLFEAELANKDKSEKYDEEVRQIRDENQSNYKHKVKHLLMQNMLSRLYNLLHPELNLEKGIKKSSSLDKLIGDDFMPNSSSNDEISRYIQNMILSSDRSKCGLLLRSTVAYSNMMLRKRIKEKVNEPYNPEFTFEEIENLIKTNEDERKRMKKIIEAKQDKIMNDNKLILKLQKEIKRQDDRYDELQKSVQEQFIERIKKIKTLRSDNIKKHTIKRVHTDEMGSKQQKSTRPLSTINASMGNSNIDMLKPKKQKYGASEYLSIFDNNKSAEYYNDINNANTLNQPKVFVTGEGYRRKSKGRRIITNNNICYNYFSEGLKNLVDHTNRLFLFKTKSKYAKPIKTPIERIENKFSKLKRIQKSNQKPTEISENILNNLDNIIYSIQKEGKS